MKTSGSGHGVAFRPDLQGLRAIAVLLVILAHAGVSAFSGGFVGVDVFFVLSGYLITGLLVRELERERQIALLHFYARRLKRLLPALAVMLAGTVFLAAWLLSSFEAYAQLRSGPYAATWTSNIYFAVASVDYFDDLAARDLFLHTWSLGIEEQFYLFWPLLLISLFWISQKLWGRTRQGLVWGLISVAACSFILSLYWTFEWPNAAFYLMPARAWQFAMGGLLCFLFRSPVLFSVLAQEGRQRNLVAWFVLVAGLLMITISAIVLDDNVQYPGAWALLPSLGATLTILAGAGFSRGRTGPLTHPALVWIGDRSYSLYLWHWPILILGFSLGIEPQSIEVLGLVLCSLLFAMISYEWIELPFWKGRASTFPLQRTLLASVLVMVSTVAVWVHASRFVQDQTAAENRGVLSGVDLPEIYRMPCDAWFSHARVEPCVFGPEDAPATVVLLGDSIGAQWFSMVPGIFKTPNWRTVVLTKSACPIVDEDIFYKRIGRIYDVCAEWRRDVLTWLDMERPDVLIVGNAATYDFSDEQWIEGTRRILDRVSRSSGSVVVIPGTPSLGFHGPGCLRRNIEAGEKPSVSSCIAADRVEIVRPVEVLLAQAVLPYDNVRLLSLNDFVCPGGVCSALGKNGIVVFRDQQHLTDSFVRSQVARIRERLPVCVAEESEKTPLIREACPQLEEL